MRRFAAIALSVLSVSTAFPCLTFNQSEPVKDCGHWEPAAHHDSEPVLTAASVEESDLEGGDKDHEHCLPGWIMYTDSDRSEGVRSCFKEMAFGVGPIGLPWAAANALCRSLHPKGKLITIRSKKPYTPGGANLLSVMIDNLALAPFGYAGCRQKDTSALGPLMTGRSWKWVDSTSDRNLLCEDPASGSCSTGVWGTNDFKHPA